MEGIESNSAPCLPIHFELIDVWQRVLGCEVRNIDASFIELGGAEFVAAMLDEVAALTLKRVTAAEFLSDPTIRHLTRNVLAQRSGDSVFKCVQPGNGLAPFYYFHGDILGGGFYAARLAGLLGAERPMFVTSPLHLPEHRLPTVENIAARKRRALQRLQPHGPYMLGGFCVGAVVAYEVARQLEVEGEDVCGVILIEPEIGNALTRSHQRVVNRVARRRGSPREKVDTFARGARKLERITNVWSSPWPEKAKFLLHNTRKLIAKEQTPSAAPEIEPAQEPANDSPREWLLSAYRWVVNSYVPRRFAGRVTLFVTEEHRKQAPFIVRQWKKAVPRAQVETVPGEHLTCITTHLDELAGKIHRELETVKALLGVILPTLVSEVVTML